MKRKSIRWLIPGILPRPGLTVLMGPPFSGKSFLALQLGLDLARGESPFGRSVPKDIKVLYLQLDTSELIWRERILDLKASGVDVSVPVYMPHPAALPVPTLITNQEVRVRLRGMLTELKPDVVIIDVLRELHQYDENDSTAQKIVFDYISSVFRDYALILLHHSKKLFGSIAGIDPIMLCRGSTYIPGRADAIWLLAQGKLKIVSRFSETILLPAAQKENGFFLLGEQRDTAPSVVTSSVSDRDAHVLDLCRKKPKDQSYDSLYKSHQKELQALGVSRATFYRILRSSPELT